MTATSVLTQSFGQIRAELAGAIESEDDFRADAIVRAYSDRAADAIGAHDVAAIVDLRAQVARLSRRTTRADESELARSVVGRLDLIDGMLDRGETAARMSRAAADRDRDAGKLADAIAVLLRDGPRRPRELAQHFGCDPSQVSRALRALVEDGRASRVEPPSGVTDRRAHWFGLPD